MSQGNPALKRKTLRLTNPNPLFEKWLTEWKDEAALRNSDTQYAFAKALKSLKKYPLPLKSGKECLILEHFGTRICLLIDRKLAEYFKTHPIKEKEDVEKVGLEKPGKSNDQPQVQSPKTRPHKASPTRGKKGKTYMPSLRSSSYAVLLALYHNLKKNPASGEMTKAELQKAAQPLCDTSMFKPLPGTYYSGWSCVGQLTGKQLVLHIRNINPHRYKLTQEGIELAEQLSILDPSIQNLSPCSSPTKNPPEGNIKRKVPLKKKNKIDCTTFIQHSEAVLQLDGKTPTDEDFLSQCSTETQESLDEGEIFLPGAYQTILLVDTQEIHKGDELQKALEAQGVVLEVRKLTVGDFAWICRNREGQELLLPYLIERKRLDDLASSIKDGRFHEQKFRMKQSGVPNCMYLVESHGQRQYSLPTSTLLQAAVNTQFVDKFTVKHTANSHETVVYLATFTKVIARTFADKTLLGCKKSGLPSFKIEDDCVSLMSFKEFNKLSSKVRKYSVKEMFIKQLVQLKGLSVEKALAIVEKYPCPNKLISTYSQTDEGEKLLADIPAGNLKRKIGPVISKAVCDLYNKPVLS